MARQFKSSDLDALESLVRGAPDGLGLDAITKALPGEVPRRNLQRRLAALVRTGRLRVEGRGRATRYHRQRLLVEATGTAAGHATALGMGEVRLAVTPEAEEIRSQVSRPQHARQPAGYRRQFLDDYRPNVTAYLPEEMRARLRESGSAAAQAPVAGTFARQILGRLLIDLSWNSSRLEGNTYSLLETQRLLELGQSAEGKAAAETQMILNHKAAIEFLVDGADEIGFDRRTILNLHALLSDNLLPRPEAGGRLRAIAVSIAHSVYHPPEVPQLVEECFQQVLDTGAAIRDPYEQAFFVMVQLPYLQPFEDVNKRVSRLAANIPLIRHNLCPLSFADVPQDDYVRGLLGVYELNRIELLRDVFVWAYERSAKRYAAVRQSLGEPDAFRLRYRAPIVELIGEIVRQRLDRARTPDYVRAWVTGRLPVQDHARFQEMIETDLLAMHEGNYSRYRLRPSEFEAWKAVW